MLEVPALPQQRLKRLLFAGHAAHAVPVQHWGSHSVAACWAQVSWQHRLAEAGLVYSMI